MFITNFITYHMYIVLKIQNEVIISLNKYKLYLFKFYHLKLILSFETFNLLFILYLSFAPVLATTESVFGFRVSLLQLKASHWSAILAIEKIESFSTLCAAAVELSKSTYSSWSSNLAVENSWSKKPGSTRARHTVVPSS